MYMYDAVGLLLLATTTMPLTLHHLGLSQSERIIWLAEELGLKYTLVKHHRDPLFAPPSIKALHPAGTAPVMEDDPSPVTNAKVVLAESGAIVSYLINVYGGGRLSKTPQDGPDYVHYEEWFHFANGTVQPALLAVMAGRRHLGASESAMGEFQLKKWERVLSMLNARLAATNAYLVGSDLTAADIMTVFTLTTMRGFYPVVYDEEKQKPLLGYLERVGERPAYKRAMKLCEGDAFEPLLAPKVELFSLLK